VNVNVKRYMAYQRSRTVRLRHHKITQTIHAMAAEMALTSIDQHMAPAGER